MPAKSLLFSSGSVLNQPVVCAPGRQEVKTTIKKNGRIYNLVMRDKTLVDDPYFVLVKAAGFALSENEPYMGRLPPRALRDFLIKSSVIKP